MTRTVFSLALCVMLAVSLGCGRRQTAVEFKTIEQQMIEKAVVQSGVAVKVEEVSNVTGELFDVDVIGIFWDALEKHLYQEGSLWTRERGGMPMLLEARITKYSKGNIVMRYLVPYFGETELAVECDLKEGDNTVASVQVERVVSLREGFTFKAWKNVFDSVAEEVVGALLAQAKKE